MTSNSCGSSSSSSINGNTISNESSSSIASNESHNEIDELLHSGKIANAIDYYNYFKNKQFTQQSAQQPQIHDSVQPRANTNASILKTVSSNSANSPSSLSPTNNGAATHVELATNTVALSPSATQISKQRANSKKMKPSNNYSNLMQYQSFTLNHHNHYQQGQQQQQPSLISQHNPHHFQYQPKIKHVHSFNNGISLNNKSKYKKTFSSNNLFAFENKIIPENSSDMATVAHLNFNKHLISNNFSMSSFSIPTQVLCSNEKSNNHSGFQNKQFSIYSLDTANSNTYSSDNNKTIKQYSIDVTKIPSLSSSTSSSSSSCSTTSNSSNKNRNSHQLLNPSQSMNNISTASTADSTYSNSSKRLNSINNNSSNTNSSYIFNAYKINTDLANIDVSSADSVSSHTEKDSNHLKSNDSNNGNHIAENNAVNNNNDFLPSSSSIQSISSIFLNSNLTTYYQKYKNQQQKHQAKPPQRSATVASVASNYDLNEPGSQNNLFNELQPQLAASSNTNFDRKKEDAINRIIRNEKIKQIRIKIYEYELLKEYQTVNTSDQQTNFAEDEKLNADLSSSSSSLSSSRTANYSDQKKVTVRGIGSIKKKPHQPVNESGYINNKQQNNTKKTMPASTKPNKTIPSARANNNNQNSNKLDIYSSFNEQLKTKIKNNDQSTQLEIDINQTDKFTNDPNVEEAESPSTTDRKELDINMFDDKNSFFNSNLNENEFNDENYNEEDLEGDGDDLELGDNFDDTEENLSFIDNLDEENYESGIEDDGFNKIKQQQCYQEHQIQTNLNRIFQNSNNNSNTKSTGRRYVRPGYEIYQIGGPSNNSFAHTINLSSAAQSTFQLKISIISTEVKNIVNILKQVQNKFIVYFCFIFTLSIFGPI
jgi:hypothetical protein